MPFDLMFFVSGWMFVLASQCFYSEDTSFHALVGCIYIGSRAYLSKPVYYSATYSFLPMLPISLHTKLSLQVLVSAMLR